MAHALLSASSAYRWLNCTAAPRLEEQFPDKTSEYAEEGTRAHALAERLLRARLDAENYTLSARDIDKDADGEMVDAVNSYADTVCEAFLAAKSDDPGACIFIEQRLDFSDYVPDGFGTGDAVIIGGGTIEVIDLKYGKGVRVSAEENPQLKLYGLGAYISMAVIYDLDVVRMTIVQPRLDAVSSYAMKVKDLEKWAKGIKKTAKKAYDGKGEYAPGDHCKFCKASARCRALANEMERQVELDKDAPTLSDLEVANVLAKATAVRSWIKSVEDMALAKALDGYEWPGYKVVAGRGRRVIVDEVAAGKALEAAGVEDVYTLKTLTALEKLAGKKQFNEVVGPFVEMKDGNPTLAPLEDKRPELNRGDVFNDDYKEEQ